MTSQVLDNTAAIPGGDPQDLNQYPILGHLVWYSLRDVRVKRAQLEQLLTDANISNFHMPPEIRPPDAFRRATSAIATQIPIELENGRLEHIMIREVYSDSKEIVRHIIREETDRKNKRIEYGKIGQVVFNRTLEKMTVGINPQYEHHKNRLLQKYKEFEEMYVGKHIRDMVYKMLHSTVPVSVRPAGGVYFVAKEHSDLIESLETFVESTNKYGTTVTDPAVLESVPMLDIVKQRQLIFNRYEDQVTVSVDTTMTELTKILKSTTTPTKGQLKNYVNKVKDLKGGIAKYEELLKQDLITSRNKCQILQDQVKSLLDKAAVSEIVPDVTEGI